MTQNLNSLVHSSADLSITVLKDVNKNDDLYRKEREKYFIRKFNTFYMLTLNDGDEIKIKYYVQAIHGCYKILTINIYCFSWIRILRICSWVMFQWIDLHILFYLRFCSMKWNRISISEVKFNIRYLQSAVWTGRLSFQ